MLRESSKPSENLAGRRRMTFDSSKMKASKDSEARQDSRGATHSPGEPKTLSGQRDEKKTLMLRTSSKSDSVPSEGFAASTASKGIGQQQQHDDGTLPAVSGQSIASEGEVAKKLNPDMKESNTGSGDRALAADCAKRPKMRAPASKSTEELHETVRKTKMMLAASKCTMLMNHATSKMGLCSSAGGLSHSFDHTATDALCKKPETLALLMAGALMSWDPALLPRAEPKSSEPWCMPILRTEAYLRLSEDYINQTRVFFDAGLPPPESLDVAVEMQALRLHGFGAETMHQYRAAARSLSLEERSDIFFLRANDKLFRPRAELVGKPMTGSVLKLDAGCRPVCADLCENLSASPATLLIASTSS